MHTIRKTHLHSTKRRNLVIWREINTPEDPIEFFGNTKTYCVTWEIYTSYSEDFEQLNRNVVCFIVWHMKTNCWRILFEENLFIFTTHIHDMRKIRIHQLSIAHIHFRTVQNTHTSEDTRPQITKKHEFNMRNEIGR